MSEKIRIAMSYDGRTSSQIARKMLTARPLGGQRGASDNIGKDGSRAHSLTEPCRIRN